MIHKKEACEVKRVFKKNQIIIAALAARRFGDAVFANVDDAK